HRGQPRAEDGGARHRAPVDLRVDHPHHSGPWLRPAPRQRAGPQLVAFAVVGLLEQNFGALVDYDFTSAMEDQLDAIAEGNEDRTKWLEGFYFGGGTSSQNYGLKNVVAQNLENIDARRVNSLHLFDDANGVP